MEFKTFEALRLHELQAIPRRMEVRLRLMQEVTPDISVPALERRRRTSDSARKGTAGAIFEIDD